MAYKVFADIVVSVHLLWILFLIFGAFWGMRNRIIKTFHVVGLGFALAIQVFGWYCPLTHLEIWLRARHDPSLAYSGSFIIQYVERIVYLRISPVAILILTVILCGCTAWYYRRKRG